MINLGGTFCTANRFSAGNVFFAQAEFSDAMVNFGDATFSGGTVDLSASAGAAPTGLLPSRCRPD
ncbi:hypothetical protein ACF08N_35900 [Streptomyces sp. NPDC015127]|uniref:hypothetical protein n=1 Tax=Streptomyces sp. NPDC015127 TaxID=3364939 RepID=UPI0036FB8A49